MRMPPLPRLPTVRPIQLSALLVVAWLLAGCATQREVDEAAVLSQAGQHEQALALLAEARVRKPDNASVRSTELRLRERALADLVLQAESARSAARPDDAARLLRRAQAVDHGHPRVLALAQSIQRDADSAALLRAAQTAEAEGQIDTAAGLLQRLGSGAAGDPAVRALQRRLRERRAASVTPSTLAPALQRPVSMEFRDAPLRHVLEGLGQLYGLNFVFDREVRADAKVQVLLKDTPLADALHLILSSQQLASKVLNDRTLLVYPDTTAKQREHRELVTRSFFLANADARQALVLLRTIAKTRDLFVDERLNQIIVRDTPEALQLVDRLLASIDVPEPEVVLEVEVLEVSSSRMQDLGLDWPSQLSYGLPGAAEIAPLSSSRDFRGSIANPALLATLRETLSRSNIIANPRLRARNREKARVLVGEKLPVFTTTSTANVGVSSAVTYLDVGLKLEVEPTVQLEGDVVIRVALEVSTLIARVPGPQGSVGYQVGTREASTSLRLRDGETQILAGLIRDEDSKTVSGLPGLAALPVLGRLFGVHSDQRSKTEVILLITPRVVRTVVPPEAALIASPAGSESDPGALPWRLSAGAAVQVPMSARGGMATATSPSAAGLSTSARAGMAGSADDEAQAAANLVLSSSASATVGGTASVTLANRSGAVIEGELSLDPGQLQQAAAGAAGGGRQGFKLQPGQEQVFVLRVLPSAAGQQVRVGVSAVIATDLSGEAVAVNVPNDIAIRILSSGDSAQTAP